METVVSARRPGTLVLHRACDTPIFFVEGGIRSGEPLPPAVAWKPLDASWPQPTSGDRTICPNCHAPFLPNDEHLLRTNVEDW